MVNGNLPKGWVIITLADILKTLESGSRPKGGVQGILEGIPSIGGEHLLYNGGFDFSNIRFIPIAFFEDMLRGRIHKNDVLVVKDGATTGKTSFVSESFPFDEAAVNEHVFILRAYPDGVLQKYLFYWMQSPFGQQCVEENFKGTAQGGINSSFIENSQFPLAPIPEQERIVARIEELFTQLEAGTAALKRVRAGLKRYKASVLKAAVKGRLLQSGRSAAAPVPGNDDLPDGWKWTTVGQIGTTNEQTVLTGPFGSNLGSDDFIDTGIPVLTIGCLTEQGINLGKAKYISKEKAAELARYTVREGDLLFSRMATIGRAGLVTKEYEGAIFNYHIMRLRLAENVIDPDFFLAYVRGSSTVHDYVKDVNHGATRDGINTEQLLAMPVVLPPLAEQRRIVAEVERRLSVTQELENLLERMLVRSTRLRQSILKQAFEGKLVAQNSQNESAEKLLERIRETRKLEEAQKKTEPSKKKEKKMSIKQERQPLYETLMSAQGARLSPDQLFRSSGYEVVFRDEDDNQAVFDAFYEELRSEIKLGRIIEDRPNYTEVYLLGVKL